MGHTLNAFIAPLDHLQRIAPTLPGARVVPLAQGLALLPLPIPELYDPAEPLAPLGEGLHLPARLAAWAISHSATTPIAYIETSYHAGAGHQSAVVWHNGHLRFGPDTYDNETDPARALADFPINSALRSLGLLPSPGSDEFDTLALNHPRSTEQWYAQTFPPVT